MEITFPGESDMRRRLEGFDTDPHTVETLYPLVLERAGRQLPLPAVLHQIVLIRNEWLSGVPREAFVTASMRIPALVKALWDVPTCDTILNTLRDIGVIN